MKVVSIDLKGDFACFRKNDANDIVFSTYSFIHRPVLLGIFGAILGLTGYTFSNGDLPEYYKILKNLKIGIEPLFKKISLKNIVKFTNTSGLGTKEKGSWIISEQVLVGLDNKLSFRIFLDLKSIPEKLDDLYRKLKKGETEYPLYFGKNEFLAYYDNFLEYDTENMNENNEIKVSTIFPADKFIKKKKEYSIFEFGEKIENILMVFEELPYDFDNNFIYLKKKFVWFSEGKCSLDDKKNFFRVKSGEEDKIIYLIGGSDD